MASAGQSLTGPGRRLGNDRAGITGQMGRDRLQRQIPGVADGNQHVAHEAVAADALDCRPAEHVAESRIVQPCQLHQPRRRDIGWCTQLFMRCRPGETVPWADCQAVITTVYAIAHQRSQLMRDRSWMLDREIRYAARCIEAIWRGE